MALTESLGHSARAFLFGRIEGFQSFRQPEPRDTNSLIKSPLNENIEEMGDFFRLSYFGDVGSYDA